MIPFRNLAETVTPDGSRLTLHEHDGDYFIKLNGRQLMSSTSTSSELLLAERGCSHLAHYPSPRVLIGGLGLGFTLERVLDSVGRNAVVHVAELVPQVVTWNREFLKEVNGGLLDDPRVEVKVADVFALLRAASGGEGYDAILLDVDNGPTSFVQPKNSRIYNRRGLAVIRSALRPGGRVAFWSAEAEPLFAHSLQRAGFDTESIPAKANEHAKRFAHMIYVGIRGDGAPR
ncbi:MAG: spermine synthase [Verrucomicrobiota bacterium]|nr:spermine synthase [Verrucomicrobiota bacterium]